MTGTVHIITAKRTFDFTNVATSSTMSIPVARAIDVKHAKSIQLIVRAHSYSLVSGTSCDVTAEQVSITPEEPDADFVGQSVTSVSFTGSGSSALKVGALSTTPLGHMIRVRVSTTRAGTSGTATATLSIDLLVSDN